MFYQGKKCVLLFFPVSRNLIIAPLFKRNISRTFNFRAAKCAKKYEFRATISSRSGSARKLDVRENLVN